MSHCTCFAETLCTPLSSLTRMPLVPPRCSHACAYIYICFCPLQVDRKQINAFFEQTCGPIAKSRLLGQSHHPTRIAFIEFARAESAMGALNCSGAMLGSFPIRYGFRRPPHFCSLCRLCTFISYPRATAYQHNSDAFIPHCRHYPYVCVIARVIFPLDECRAFVAAQREPVKDACAPEESAGAKWEQEQV